MSHPADDAPAPESATLTVGSSGSLLAMLSVPLSAPTSEGV